MPENENEKTGSVINPLSMPLEKSPTFDSSQIKEIPQIFRKPGEPTDKTAPEKPETGSPPSSEKMREQRKTLTEKELFKKLYERIDEQVEKRTVSGKRPFLYFGLILLAVFLSPFLFYGGTDLYHLSRGYLFEYFGVMPTLSDKYFSQTLASQNREIIKELGVLVRTQKEIVKSGIQKVVVINNEPGGTFSFKFEKKKLFELSGIDIDDPIKGTKKIGKIKSVDVLIAIMDSFNRILWNGAQYGVSNFHIKNVIEGKRQALKKLQELK